MSKDPNEDINIRIPFSQDIKTRDGTLTKDSQMWNCFVQHTKKGPVVEKRPGLILSQQLTAGIGQGSFAFYVGGGGNGDGSTVGNATPVYSSPPLGTAGSNSNPGLPDADKSHLYIIVNDTLIPNVTTPPPPTWSTITSPPGSGTAFLTNDGTSLYALRQNTCNVYKSANGGTSWSLVGKVSLIDDLPSWFFGVGTSLYASLKGEGGSDTGNNVYKSTDGGVTWTESAAQFDVYAPRTIPQLFQAAFASSTTIYNINGDPSGYPDLNGEVFASTNGVTWNQLVAAGGTEIPPWEAFSDQNNAIFGGNAMFWSLGSALYLFGGSNPSAAKLPNVWKSTDTGATWSLLTAAPACGALVSSSVFVVGSTVYLAGGSNGTAQTKIWQSTDGSTWTENTSYTLPVAAAFLPSQNTVLGGVLYMCIGTSFRKITL